MPSLNYMAFLALVGSSPRDFPRVCANCLRLSQDTLMATNEPPIFPNLSPRKATGRKALKTTRSFPLALRFEFHARLVAVDKF